MASDHVWAKLRYFKKTDTLDNWGDASAIADDLLLALDDFRHFVGVPVYVLSGTNGIHSPSSFHYIENGACAVDVALPEYRGTPIDLLFDVFRFPFSGVGFYPDWQYRGEQAKGLHLDTRPVHKSKDGRTNFKESRWVAIRDSLGSQKYLAFDFETINRITGGNQWIG